MASKEGGGGGGDKAKVWASKPNTNDLQNRSRIISNITGFVISTF